MSGGNDVELPKPMPNKAMPRHSNGTLEPAAAMNAREPVICTAQLAQATSRRSAPSGMIQPTSVRPAIAKAVANAIAMPACCAPSTGTRSENKCATKPICANSPKAFRRQASGTRHRSKAAIRGAASQLLE